MKALVTGADGFVGQYLVAELLEQGFAVAASVRDLPPCRTTLTPAHVSSVEWKAADVRDHDALYRVVAATLPERIYHLAGFSSGALARRFASDAVHVNTGGTVNLFEAVVSVREDDPAFDPRVLVMGSGDAYGDAALEGQPLEEHLSLRPVSRRTRSAGAVRGARVLHPGGTHRGGRGRARDDRRKPRRRAGFHRRA
jgi:GDP-4-dehydro-6-deoxy-D-mannose reductase